MRRRLEPISEDLPGDFDPAESGEQEDGFNPHDLTAEQIRELVSKRHADIQEAMESLSEDSTNGVPLSWNGLLKPDQDLRVCRDWAKNTRFWFTNKTKLSEAQRRLFNTFDMPMDVLRKQLQGLFKMADDVVDEYLRQLFVGRPDLEKKWATPDEIKNCNEPAHLLSYAVFGHPTTKDECKKNRKIPRRTTFVRWAARRKLALTLLVRGRQQEPGYVFRHQDARHFEDFLLQDKVDLIDPAVGYQPVKVAFQVYGNQARDIHEVTDDKPKEDELVDFEVVSLLKLKISGFQFPYSTEKTELTVYAFPGNRFLEEQKLPGFTRGDRLRMQNANSIVDYKSLSSIALKQIRYGPDKSISDFIRCTFLVDNDRKLEILQNIINTAFFSTVNRRELSEGGSSVSSREYRDAKPVHMIEEIHNEHANPPRNYQIEIRAGLMSRLLLDKSRTSPANHWDYKIRRSLEISPWMFPHDFCPEFIEDEEVMAKVLKQRREAAKK